MFSLVLFLSGAHSLLLLSLSDSSGHENYSTVDLGGRGASIHMYIYIYILFISAYTIIDRIRLTEPSYKHLGSYALRWLIPLISQQVINLVYGL